MLQAVLVFAALILWIVALTLWLIEPFFLLYEYLYRRLKTPKKKD